MLRLCVSLCKSVKLKQNQAVNLSFQCKSNEATIAEQRYRGTDGCDTDRIVLLRPLMQTVADVEPELTYFTDIDLR